MQDKCVQHFTQHFFGSLLNQCYSASYSDDKGSECKMNSAGFCVIIMVMNENVHLMKLITAIMLEIVLFQQR